MHALFSLIRTEALLAIFASLSTSQLTQWYLIYWAIPGLGIDHFAAVQGYNRIQYLIGHLRSKSLTGKLIWNQLEYTQLEVGCVANPLALRYDRYKSLIMCPNWVTATWRQLHMCQASINVTPQWAPRKSRINDIIIMEALTDLSSGLIPKDLRTLNRCRLYLRFFFLSDVRGLLAMLLFVDFL
jgi:hypothetical protein